MNRKIKVLQITHDLALGGLQRVVATICRAINRDEFDVEVLCLRDLGCFTKDIVDLGIPVTLIKQPKDGTDYFSFLKVAQFLMSKRPDVLHTHNTQPLLDGTLAALMTGRCRIIHTDHARSFPDKKKYMIAEKIASHFVYKMVGVSEHTSKNLVQYENISVKKIVTIPNGIDPFPFQKKIDCDIKRKELEITKDKFVIGTCVRLSEQKGLTYLLNAMPNILSQVPQAHLVIAGTGPLESSLRDETKKLGITNNVTFLGHRDDTTELLQIFDVYVLPSLWEGLPMILLEAMAAKCPIIATNVGGVGNALEHGKAGILIEPKNPEAIEKAVMVVVKDRQTVIKMCEYAERHFQKNYTARVMVSQYENLYKDFFRT